MSEIISGTVIDVWEVRGQGDSDFGNAATYTVAWYRTESEALVGARGKGSWGRDGEVNRHQVLKQDHEDGSSSYYKLQEIEITSADLNKVREEALGKLSPLEKKLLGLQ